MIALPRKIYRFFKKKFPEKFVEATKEKLKPFILKLESKPFLMKWILRPYSKKPIYCNRSYLIEKTKKGLKRCTLVGYPKAKSGLGQHIRYVCSAFIECQLPFSIDDYSDTAGQQLSESSLSAYIDPASKNNCQILCHHYTSSFLDTKKIRKDCYRIYYGYWELNDFPDKFLSLFNYMDEIWAPTQYIQNLISKKSVLPVIHMPVPIHFEIPKSVSKKDFGLPEKKLIILFSFDFSSTSKRKNPFAIIEAYRHAFSCTDSVHLLIKCFTNNKGDEIDIYNQLKQIVDPSHMTLIFENLDRKKMNALLSVCDCYISLHRAEGLGLGMAESMFLGKAVIGTNFSGNTDFMNAENSCLVNYQLIKVEKGEYFGMEENSFWAEPDIEHASFYLRKIYQDAEFRKTIGQKAAHHIRENYNPLVIGKKYEERLKILNLL